MIKLIRLEYKKNHIRKYILITVLLSAALLLFCFAQTYWGIARDAETGIIDAAEGKDTVESYVELWTTISFLIFASAMQSSFTVDAYKNKTIDLMFQYPIQRKKIIIAKILAVLIFSLTALVLCKLLIYIVLYIGSLYLTADFSLEGVKPSSLKFYITIVLQSLSTVGLSVIALYIGLILKSTKAPIIASFFLIFLTQGSIGDFSLSNSLLFLIVLYAVSCLCAVLCVVKIETKDVGGGRE